MLNLVVVAHPDDEILGFGAAGAKLSSAGELVQPVILCGNVDVRFKRPEDAELYSNILSANRVVGFENPVLGSFPNIRMNNVDHLEIVQFIEQQILKFKPERIFTHHPNDLNDDHVQVSRACLAASRLYQRRSEVPALKALSFMEIPSSTDWGYDFDGRGFMPNHYIEIADEIELKLQALSCYKDVMRDFPHPRSVEAITGLAAYRGAQSNQSYAEAFQTIFARGF